MLPRLLLWARHLHRRYLDGLPGAPSAEDLVQDAATDVLTGRRACPAGIPVFAVLHGIVRSHVSNALARASVPRADGFTLRTRSLDDMDQARQEAPDTLADRAAVRERALALVADDAVLGQIVALWFDDPALKPLDLAEMLGLTPTEVYHAAKRLRRRLEPLGPLLRDGGPDGRSGIRPAS